jgi:hypothetical protein
MGDRRRTNQQDKSKRGRHKKARSKEVKAWVERTTCPKPPSWMDADTYERLAALRREVDPLQ